MAVGVVHVPPLYLTLLDTKGITNISYSGLLLLIVLIVDILVYSILGLLLEREILS